MKLTNKLIQKKNNYVRPNTSAVLFKNKYFLFLKINFICIKQKKILNELAKHLELKKNNIKKKQMQSDKIVWSRISNKSNIERWNQQKKQLHKMI